MSPMIVTMFTDADMTKKAGAYVAPSRAGKVNLAIWTDADLRKAVKMAAIQADIGVAEFIEQAIKEKLASTKGRSKK